MDLGKSFKHKFLFFSELGSSSSVEKRVSARNQILTALLGQFVVFLDLVIESDNFVGWMHPLTHFLHRIVKDRVVTVDLKLSDWFTCHRLLEVEHAVSICGLFLGKVELAIYKCLGQ